MPRGRPRKPDVLKKLEGNPGKGPLNENAPLPDGRPVRPAYVTDFAAEVWDQITNSMPAEIYSATDAIALATFCVAADQFRATTEQLKLEGFTVVGVDGLIKANPAAVIQSRAISTIALLSSRLGLDPVSRASMCMPKLKKEASKFEGLMNVPITSIPLEPDSVSELLA